MKTTQTMHILRNNKPVFLFKGVTYDSDVGDNCMRSDDTSNGTLWYDTNCGEDHQVLCEFDCGNINNINIQRNCKSNVFRNRNEINAIESM